MKKSSRGLLKLIMIKFCRPRYLSGVVDEKIKSVPTKVVKSKGEILVFEGFILKSEGRDQSKK